jgi:hypothetical protein
MHPCINVLEIRHPDVYSSQFLPGIHYSLLSTPHRLNIKPKYPVQTHLEGDANRILGEGKKAK